MSMLKSILKSGIPLIFGILIGAGLTRNKNVFFIIIAYVVVMILFKLLADKISNVKKAEDKKMAARNEVVKTINSTIELTEEGNKRGGNIFDKHYKNYSFYFGIILFVTMVILAISGLWLWVLVTFLGLHFHIVFNQIARVILEVKDERRNVHKRFSKGTTKHKSR